MGMIGGFLIVVNNCSKKFAQIKKRMTRGSYAFLQVATGKISPANRQETRFY